jgi:hypothetical protein
VIAGLLPYDQSLSKSALKGPAEVKRMQDLVDAAIARGELGAVPYQMGHLVAVKRAGTVKFLDKLKEGIAEAEVVKVLQTLDSKGKPRFITSDVDPFAFALPNGEGLGEARSTPNFGMITEKEKRIVKEYNRQFRALMEQPESRSQFMTHGAENAIHLFRGSHHHHIARHVGWNDGQLARSEMDGALANDGTAVGQEFIHIVGQVEHQFGPAKNAIDLAMNGGAILRGPIHQPVKFLIKFVRTINQAIHMA